MPGAVDLLLKNVTLPDGRVADISVDGGRVRHAGAPLSASECIDCTGRLCIPAGIDMHVHMRGWEQAQKEDWRSGTMSALAGGVTVVVDQPNTVPPLTSPDIFSERVAVAQKHSLCHFAVNADVSPGADLDGMWLAGAMAFGEIFAAPSSYGEALDRSALADALARITRIGGLATIHAEEVMDVPDTDLPSHDRARPKEGEMRTIEMVQRLAGNSSHLHFCHISTADGVDAVRGSVEVAPHHLFLSLDHFAPDDACGKVNPPLRHEHERRSLWTRWDQIDVIASDHAPHTRAEKDTAFSEAPAGLPGVETMLPLLIAAVLKGTVPLASLIRKTSHTPAAILAIPRAGFDPGDRADFAIYPREISTVDPDSLHSRCGWTPFAGLDAVFPIQVVMGGDLVYDAGEYMHGRPHWYHGRGYIK